MKHPNDTKRKNSKSGSLGQFLRSREKFIHVSFVPGWIRGITYRKAGA